MNSQREKIINTALMPSLDIGHSVLEVLNIQKADPRAIMVRGIIEGFKLDEILNVFCPPCANDAPRKVKKSATNKRWNYRLQIKAGFEGLAKCESNAELRDKAIAVITAISETHQQQNGRAKIKAEAEKEAALSPEDKATRKLKAWYAETIEARVEPAPILRTLLAEIETQMMRGGKQ